MSADGVPAFVVFHDRALAEIPDRSPLTLAGQAQIAGAGAPQLDGYRAEVVARLACSSRPTRG